MRNGIAGIDHVILGVRDLEAARAAWQRLGFAVTPRGRHVGQGTANYCIMFARDYLELLGILDASEGTQKLNGFLARREGPMAAAFALAAAPEPVRAALQALGLHPAAPRPLGRLLESPDGTVMPRFSLIDLPPEETPALDCFLCGHLTPELMRRPEWLLHPNGTTGIRSLSVVVRDTAPLLPAYDRLFGIPQVTTTDAIANVRIGPHRIVFSTPDDFLTMHPGRELAGDFPLPGIAALDLAVARRDDTARYLRSQDIAFADMADGSLAVAPAEATGAMIFFTEG